MPSRSATPVFTPTDANLLYAMKQSTAEPIAERGAEAKEQFPGPASRPPSITIASWILIIWPSAALPLIVSVGLFEFLDSKSVKRVLTPDTLLAIAGLLIILWFGIGMRRGLKWARLLWLWFVPAVIVFIFLTEPDAGVIALIVYAIHAVILNRRPARLYFTRGGL